MRTKAFVLAIAVAAALIGLIAFYRPWAEHPDRPSSTETGPIAGTPASPTTDAEQDRSAPPDAREAPTTPDESDGDTPQGGVISGTVTDEMGTPVAEASVYFVSAELFTEWLKDIRLPPFAQDEQEDELDDDAPEATSGSAFTLPYDAGESGMDLWAFAGPFGGLGLDAGHEPATQVKTATDGTYVSGALRPGTYTVIARKRFHWPEVWQSIEVGVGAHVSGVGFALKEQASISGVVVRETGVPVSGSHVETSSRSWAPAETSGDGSFLIAGLRPGRYTVTADAEGLLRTRLKVMAPSSDLRIVLRDGGTIRGRVIDKQSREPVETYWISWRRYDVTREDEDTHDGGRFVLTGLPSGLHNVEVRAPGCAPAVVKDIRVEAPHETGEVLVELVKGTTLAFTVISAADNSTVVGARIIPVGEWEQDELGVTTGEDGTCTCEHFRPGTYRFIIRHEEFAAKLVTINLTAQDELKNVEVLLDKGLTLHGRVVTRDEQAPIDGANVSLIEEGHYRAGFTTTTDAEGAFSLTKVPPGHYTVKAAHAGYAFASVERFFDRDFDENLTIELGPAIHLVVEVTNADGTPHEGAGVMIFGPGVADLGGFTDKEGRYVLEDCPPGRYHVRVGEAGKKGMGAFKDVEIPAGKETTVSFTLGGGARLHGTVTLDGAPMEDLYVYASPRETKPGGRINTIGLDYSTDAHGRYSIPGLQPGEYELRIWLDHAADTAGAISGQGRNVTRRSFALGTEDLELDIELGGESVMGTVLDETGIPLQDANVSIVPVPDEATRLDALLAVDCADEGWHSTDGDGRFTIMGIGEGTYRLLVTRHGYAPKTVLVEKHAGRDLTDVVIALEQQCSMRVRCRGADGRMPRRISLTIADEQGRFLTQESAYVDTETGQARIEELSRGWLTVVAQASGYAPCWSKVNVRPDVDTVLDLELRAGWPVSVRVLDDGGSPVSGATVFLDPEGDPALSSMLASEGGDAVTDADGRACLEHVADGQYYLHVLHTADEPKTVDFQVSGSAADTTVTLEPKRLQPQ